MSGLRLLNLTLISWPIGFVSHNRLAPGMRNTRMVGNPARRKLALFCRINPQCPRPRPACPKTAPRAGGSSRLACCGGTPTCPPSRHSQTLRSTIYSLAFTILSFSHDSSFSNIIRYAPRLSREISAEWRGGCGRHTVAVSTTPRGTGKIRQRPPQTGQDV